MRLVWRAIRSAFAFMSGGACVFWGVDLDGHRGAGSVGHPTVSAPGVVTGVDALGTLFTCACRGCFRLSPSPTFYT